MTVDEQLEQADVSADAVAPVPEPPPEPVAVPAPADDAKPTPVDVAGVPDTSLRSALEFAVGIAAAGQKLRPPLSFPSGLKPYLKFNRLDRAALHAVRRAVIGDEEFRNRIAGVATAELVDEIGIAWLQRTDEWQARVRALHAAAKDAAEEASTEVALRKAERRREAAESVAARANAELIGHNDTLAREQLRREKAEQAAAASAAEVGSLRNEITGLRREVDKLRQRMAAETDRAGKAEAALADVREQLAAVEAMRDEILAQRVLAAPSPSPSADSGDNGDPSATIHSNRIAARALQQAAGATRDLANALATAAEALGTPQQQPPRPERASKSPRAPQRKPIAIPGGVYGDSLAAATHVLRTPQAIVIVDGYNVAKLAWPTFELSDQRKMCIDLLEDVARRFGTEIHVVFDGADVVGGSSGRRLIRVQFSPAGVIADDVIRAEVQALPASTPVVVVTNDQAIVADVRADGANVVSSDMLLAIAGRPLQR